MNHLVRTAYMACFCCLLVVVPIANRQTVWGQEPESPKSLEHKDYDVWKTLQSSTLSNDGKWIAFSVKPAKGDATLTIRELATQREYLVERGASARFSFDSKLAVYTVSPDSELLKKLRKEKRPADELPKTKMEILDLGTGKHTTFENTSSFSMPAKASGWIAYSVNKPKKTTTVKKSESTITESYQITGGELGKSSNSSKPKPKTPAKKSEKAKTIGSTLVLRNLQTGLEIRYPNVSSRAFSKFGKRLAFTSSAEAADEDGVFIVDLANSQKRQIIAGRGNYRSLAFSENENALAFLTDRDDYSPQKPSLSLYLWEEGKKEAAKVVDAKTKGVPKNWWISSSSPSFTRDGRRLVFSTQPKPKDAGKTKEQLEKETKAKAAADPVAQLDVWHWQDPLLQPQQLLQAGLERNRSYRAVYNIRSKKMIQLGTMEITSVFFDPRSKANLAIGVNSKKYNKLRSWESPSYSDSYLINLNTGESTLVLEKVRSSASLSPDGKYISWWDADKRKYFSLATANTSASPVDLTDGINTSLANELHDRPSLPSSYGTAGWMDNDAALLIYDRFDIWQVDPTGTKSAKCLTSGDGRQSKVRYRYERLDSELRSINPSQPLFLSAFNESTKASGYCQLDLGSGKIETKLMLNERVSGLRKAKESDVVYFSRQTFRRSPDLWTSTLDFKSMSRLSQINPQQRDYSWGNAELVHYKAGDGTPLDGILIKPDDFDPQKKYPMMVYFYERYSHNLHRYTTPAAGRASINFSFYASRGYIIFIPDIPYKTGRPGESAINSVVHGVKQVIDLGFVDEKKVGVQGHSWGGYQIAYLVTQSDIFACGEAGAPVSNMTSAYGGIRWGSGMSRMFQYERTQSRIGKPLWEARDLYLENSPLFYVDKINTPLLILHNDKDGAVPWYQGIEMFVAMRRLNKPAWMLNYNGEDHGLTKPENRLDFAKRMQQFFDHYLKDAPAPKWLAKGIPAVDKGKDLGFEPAAAKK